MEKIMSPRILVIIPAFNEEGSIASTVKEVKAVEGYAIDVLVINDGSQDRTAVKANEAGAEVVTLPFNLGIGGAVQTGFRYAALNRYDIAIQIDGDGQHDPQSIPLLVKPMIDEKYAIVIGSRFIDHGGFKSSFLRRIGIRFFDMLISFLIRQRITDPTSGLRAFNRDAIRVFAEMYPQDYPEPEAIMIAKRFQLTVKEVPVVMRERGAGQSSIRYLKTLYYMIKVTLAVILQKLNKTREVCADVD